MSSAARQARRRQRQEAGRGIGCAGDPPDVPSIAKPTASRARARNKTSTRSAAISMVSADCDADDGRRGFARSVIYVCAHSSEGVDGHHRQSSGGACQLPDLLVQLEVVGASELIQLPRMPAT